MDLRMTTQNTIPTSYRTNQTTDKNFYFCNTLKILIFSHK